MLREGSLLLFNGSDVFSRLVVLEVVVDLPLVRTCHITSVITTQAVAALRLKVGSEVTAAFQATSVILTTFG